MQEILFNLQILAVAMACNILVGVYYKVNVKEIKFEWVKLLNGIIKALIIAITFVGMAYIFDCLPQLADEIGIEPKFVLLSGIVIYVTKTLTTLSKILGVSK